LNSATCDRAFAVTQPEYNKVAFEAFECDCCYMTMLAAGEASLIAAFMAGGPDATSRGQG
jgi:hypothetical protein